MRSFQVITATLALMLLGTGTAFASVIGGAVIGTGDTVSVETVSEDAGYHNWLMSVYRVDGDGNLLAIHDDLWLDSEIPGDSVSFDWNWAGEEIVFGLSVDRDDDGDFEYEFLSGEHDSGDGYEWHAALSVEADGSLLLSWEDLWGGGDQDFNDAIFRITQGARVVPELDPSAGSSAAMLLLGAMTVMVGRRRRDV